MGTPNQYWKKVPGSIPGNANTFPVLVKSDHVDVCANLVDLPNYAVEGMACHSMQLHLLETLNCYSIQFLIKI